MKTPMKWIIAICMAGTLALASGCGKEKSADQEVAQPAEIADEELPVQTDFEAEAVQQITADNYLQELDSLEKEIATE